MRRLGILTVALLLTGCGGGGDGRDEPDAAAFCARLDRLTGNDPFLAFGDTATAAEIEQAYGALVERAEELVEVAPDEARPAARDYAEAAAALDSLMAASDYDGGTVDARAYRQEELAYVDASRLLVRYLESEC